MILNIIMPSDPEDSTENPLADSPPKDEDEDFEPEPEPDPEQVTEEVEEDKDADEDEVEEVEKKKSKFFDDSEDDSDEVVVSKRIIISGENLLDAKPHMDTLNNETVVLFTLDIREY